MTDINEIPSTYNKQSHGCISPFATSGSGRTERERETERGNKVPLLVTRSDQITGIEVNSPMSKYI